MGKRIFGLLLVALISLSGNAQKYKPYVNVGVTRYDGIYSPGGELGIYGPNTWYALAYSNTEGDHYGSARMYVRTYTLGKVDNFIWGGANTPLTSEKELSYELGTAFVFNITNKLAPQISISVPFPTDKFRVAYGLSLNYWIK